MTTVLFDIALVVFVAVALHGIVPIAVDSFRRWRRERMLDEWRRDVP